MKNTMKRAVRMLILIGIAVNLIGLSTLYAQYDDEDKFGENSKLNTNFGMNITAPAGKTSPRPVS